MKALLKLEKNFWCKALVAIALFASCNAASAVTFTSVISIGDSLFDGGNEETAVISAYKFYGVPANYVPVPGYYNFKYCDGYTPSEYLAYFMGLYNKAHFFNYAVAGISSVELPQLLDYMLAKNAALDPTGLFVIYVGAHDIFQSKISRDQSAENVKNAVQRLYNNGARYFMVLNLQKMADLPNYNKLSQPEIESVNIATTTFNSALKTKLSALAFSSSIVQVDMTEFSQLINDKAVSVGFTNIKDACVMNSKACNTPKTYIYWDDVHFTNITNSYLGSFLKGKLDSAQLR